ncbi:MAG: hypothetical protein HW390_2339 [Candidatus Brocadiaceae bacterium]|nr:hypothetical protein [Candidatus Brocadiaceae bacterium]
MRIIYTIPCTILVCLLCVVALRAESTLPHEGQGGATPQEKAASQVKATPQDEIKATISKSTLARTQKPLTMRTDRETLEFFIEHVEELTKQEKGFTDKELILDARGDGKYGIQIPPKKIIGDFSLVERQADKAIYFGHGKAESFLHFAGTIVLEVGYTMLNDELGSYADVKTGVYLGFDNPAVAVLTVISSPILNPQLDKLIAKFTKRTQQVVEAAYAKKIGEQGKP